MPATVTTKEVFPLTTSETQLDEEIKLRMKAGAIRSWYEKKSSDITLFTEWNVFGEQ